MPAKSPAPSPPHAILLGFPPALFLSGLAADVAFLKTAQIQWSNFAAWLITGAMTFSVLVLLWGVTEAAAHRSGRLLLVFGIAVLMNGLGLINAFQHSRDGWSSVGAFGLILSVLASAAALAVAWMRFTMADPKVSS